MPTAGGPNTLGESNLVFAYDTGDVKNSYRGQPTLNLLYVDGATNLINGGGDIYGRCTKTDLGNGKFRFVNNGTGVSTVRLYANQPDLTNGATYNCSVYFESLIGSIGIDWCDVGITGLNYSTATSGRLAGYSSRGSYASPYYFLDINFDAGGAVTLYDPQIERRSYTTPFVEGTRSATQGLLPLVGNSTLDLNYVSFDSNAQMIFDGTDDLIDITTNFGTLSAYTFEYVAYANSGGNMPIASRTNTNFYKYGAYSWRYTHGGVGGEFYHNSGNDTGWAHWIIAYDGSTISVWENGVSKGTSSSSGTADFSGGIRIGSWASSAAYTWDGTIPIMKMYNRALTAQEVRQNYQQYKTRFNLS
jgi:hypothetical protein